MNREEIYHSDVIFNGGRVMNINDCAVEFPEFYSAWTRFYRENMSDEFILVSDCDYGKSAFYNTLYSLDISNARAHLICQLNNPDDDISIYNAPIRIKNMIYFVPYIGHEWKIYDTKSGEIKVNQIPKDILPDNRVYIKTWKCINNSIVFLPGDIGKLVKLDIKTENISYHDCLKNFSSEKNNLDISAVTPYNDCLLLFMYNSNLVYKLRTDDMSITEVFKLDKNYFGTRSAIHIPGTEYVFLIENNALKNEGNLRVIYKWNVESSNFERIDNLPTNPIVESTKNLFSGFNYYNGDLYVIPEQTDCFIKLNIQSNLATRIEIDTGHKLLERSDPFYRRWGDGIAFPHIIYNVRNNKLMATIPYDYSIAEIDFEKKELVNKQKWIVDGIEALIKNSMMKKTNNMYWESYAFSINDYIQELIKE